MEAVAIIPARGGSERIEKKNIRNFCGHPMITYSIRAAKESNIFERIVVSTDDSAIAEVAKQCGADVPFIRPAELSDDFTPTRPVINHAINQVRTLYGTPNYVCVIYATAPFIQIDELKEGFRKLSTSGIDFCFTATTFAYPTQRALRKEGNGVVMVNPQMFNSRSQDLDETYHDAGQFYWGKTEAFLENKPMFSPRSDMLILPRYRVHDIDTIEDWKRAELIFKALKALKKKRNDSF